MKTKSHRRKTLLPNKRSILATAFLAAASGCTPGPRWIALVDSTAIHIVGGLGSSFAFENPRSILFAPDGRRLFVGSENGTATLSLIRLTDGQVAGSIPLEGNIPTTMLLDRRGAALYIGHGPAVTGVSIAPFAVRFRTVACPSQIRGLTLFDHGGKAFAACANGSIAEVDVKLARSDRNVSTNTDGRPCDPLTIALSTSETVLFLVCRDSGIVRYIDRVTLEHFGSFDTGGEIAGMWFDIERRYAAFSRPNEPGILMADMRARTTVAIGLRGIPLDAVPAADGTIALLTDHDGRRQIVLIDPTEPRITGSLDAPAGTFALALWPTATPIMRWSVYPSPPLQPPQP